MPISNLPPPPSGKKKKGGLDTIEKSLILGEPPCKITNIVVQKKKCLKTKRGKWGKCVSGKSGKNKTLKTKRGKWGKCGSRKSGKTE